jgi:hypothetical protein
MSAPREGCAWDDALRIVAKERDNEYFTYYQTGEEALWRRFVDIASGAPVPEDLRVLPCWMAWPPASPPAELEVGREIALMRFFVPQQAASDAVACFPSVVQSVDIGGVRHVQFALRTHIMEDRASQGGGGQRLRPRLRPLPLPRPPVSEAPTIASAARACFRVDLRLTLALHLAPPASPHLPSTWRA